MQLNPQKIITFVYMKIRHIIELLLFSLLGCFVYFLITKYTDFSQEVASIMYSNGALAYTIVSYNILGFITLLLSKLLIKNTLQPNNTKYIIFFHLSIFIILILLNYSILVFAKYISNVEPIYNFSRNGWELLICTCIIEIIIIELILSHSSMRYTLDLQNKNLKLSQENEKVKYANLQNQLNPHFLFNSLNTLIAEIPYNPDTAVEFAKNLSNIYRYVLQYSEKTKTTIEQEINLVKSYVFMHKVRLGDCILLTNDISEDYLTHMVPPLSLQLLFENIIKHNQISEREKITIRLFIENDYLCISNTIIPKINSNSSGIGLKNLSSRCKLLTNRELIIEKTDKIFTVKIPIL